MINERVKIKPNALRAIFSLAKASLLGTLRNPTSMFFNFFFPFIFITIFGVLNFNNVSFDLGIRPNSVKEGPVYEALQKINTLKLITTKTDNQLNDDLKKGEISMVIDIQNDTPIIVGPNQQIPRYKINIEKSAASPSAANTVSSILENVTNKINFSALKPENTMISTNTTEVSGRKYEQIDFVLPGQLAFALLTNALFGISFAFVSMKKELVLKRFFATPIKKEWIMTSEIIAKMVMALAQSVIIILVGHFLFKFTLSNGFITFLSMMLLSLIGMITFLSFGLFTASISKNEDSVSPVANLIMMPQLFLSGAFFALEAFPAFLQPIAKILPMTLLNNALKMVAFDGAPITQAAPEILGLVVWAIIIYAISARLFKWE